MISKCFLDQKLILKVFTYYREECCLRCPGERDVGSTEAHIVHVPEPTGRGVSNKGLRAFFSTVDSIVPPKHYDALFKPPSISKCSYVKNVVLRVQE